jgi:hypothetical protein
MATDIVQPPGVTMCRSGEMRQMSSIAASNAAAWLHAKPLSTVA